MGVKLFECLPVLEAFNLAEEDHLSKVECIECCGQELYIGTNDGAIILFQIMDESQKNGKITFTTRRAKRKVIEQDKAVKCIKAASALNRLLVLCNQTLSILVMTELQPTGGSSKLRSISTICINEFAVLDDPFSIQVCIGRKRQLQLYNVTTEKVSCIKDITMPEPAIEIAADGPNICVAHHNQYVVYNINSSNKQMLFSYDSTSVTPIIRRIAKDEFLLTANENLGVFANIHGMSTRPPIQWSYPVLALAYFHPFILGISNEVIIVYSVLDQQHKQALPFVGGRYIGNFDGRLYTSSGTAVYAIFPVPWHQRIEALLLDGKVDEALNLTEEVDMARLSKNEIDHIVCEVYHKAAFIYFSRGDFDKALRLFQSGNIDVREVISLYPGLLPASTSFVRSVPPLHTIADVNQLFGGDQLKLKEAKMFLQNFLENARDTNLAHRLEIDTALLKLYSENNALEMHTLISAEDLECDVEECCDSLEKHRCYHALALLYWHNQDHANALQVWMKIMLKEYEDVNFPGMEFFIDCLASLVDHDLLWRYADFVLGQDEEKGVNIFVHRSEQKLEDLKPEMVVNFLHRFPRAELKYLEYLVFELKIQMETFHTHLAVLYLEKVAQLKQQGDGESVNDVRQKLQGLLQSSNLYRAHLLLNKMQEAELHKETAILYGKLEEHEKALDILVYQLKDFKAAEEYCINNVKGKDVKYKHKLYFMLLSVYLNPTVKDVEQDGCIFQALDIMNNKPLEFNANEVVKILPEPWSVAAVDVFLHSSLRNALHEYRMNKVACAFSRGQNLQKKFSLYEVQRHFVTLHENNITTNYVLLSSPSTSS
ncbi:transforming growth factor-beta receptor-associated protein 1-like isoform X2 [Bacillus rossius redtenbacheri]|uniref:transforming growth factor-beta receptor-associated protein 1-like isoform X2 n=1 Tax=Bacillus rossius redtenbacheri TaxID=93214 RepID=UPI002FDDE7EA